MDVGEIVRRLHWRAWDVSAPVPEVSMAELVSVLPLIIEGGSAGVVWPRLREQFGVDSAVGMALEAAYASQVAHNDRVEQELARVVGRLHEAGIQPVLIKGLAVARLYPAPLVRPAGDIDLVVRDEEYVAAQEMLGRSSEGFDGVRLSYHGDRAATRNGSSTTGSATNVDLHAFSHWGQAPGEGFFERARVERIGALHVLVPSVEDHLRALCKHFLVHGATRPMRLCDIALMFETRPEHFDWDRLLSGSRHDRDTVLATLGLAHILLGMDSTSIPLEKGLKPVPRWLLDTASRQLLDDSRRRTPLTAFYIILKRPWLAFTVARQNWPDPISATMRLRAPINAFPRLPVQLAFIGTRLLVFGIRIVPQDLRKRSILRQRPAR